MNKTNKTVRVHLACGHWRYFKAPVPDYGEVLFCFDCQQYQDVHIPTDAHIGRTYYADEDYYSEPAPAYKGRKKFKGVCTYSDENGMCGHEEKAGFYRLKELMHIHYMRTHTSFGAKELGSIQLELFDMQKTDAKSLRQEPPF